MKRLACCSSCDAGHIVEVCKIVCRCYYLKLHFLLAGKEKWLQSTERAQTIRHRQFHLITSHPDDGGSSAILPSLVYAYAIDNDLERASIKIS